MNKEKIIAKNEKASIALDTDGRILIDAKKIVVREVE